MALARTEILCGGVELQPGDEIPEVVVFNRRERTVDIDALIASGQACAGDGSCDDCTCDAAPVLEEQIAEATGETPEQVGPTLKPGETAEMEGDGTGVALPPLPEDADPEGAEPLPEPEPVADEAPAAKPKRQRRTPTAE